MPGLTGAGQHWAMPKQVFSQQYMAAIHNPSQHAKNEGLVIDGPVYI